MRNMRCTDCKWCAILDCKDGTGFFNITTGDIYEVSHWMPLPEPAKED